MDASFIEHLSRCKEPFVLRSDGRPPIWNDQALHQAAYDADPEFYALIALYDKVALQQRARILFQLLQRARNGLPVEMRRTMERATAFLQAILHPHQVLTVFLALRRVRANHKHTAHAVLRYILNHPHLEDMILRRRPAVADCLEHALGKRVMRACVQKLLEVGPDDPYVRKHLLRFAVQPRRAGAVLPLLYRSSVGAGLKSALGEPQYTQVHAEYLLRLGEGWRRPETITATNRGEIAATLFHIYRGGPTSELLQALDRSVAVEAAHLPRYSGHLAMVLDASASMRSYGDREYCCLAQAVALQRVLAQRCNRFQVHKVGGVGDPPQPQGSTDLASALLNALADAPDLVVIVSDGYENLYHGDLARVVATLPQAGVTSRVIFCHCKFTSQDDLTLRRPAPNLPQLEFWHQNDFRDLLLSFAAFTGDEMGEISLREYLARRLSHLEMELALWTGIP